MGGRMVLTAVAIAAVAWVQETTVLRVATGPAGAVVNGRYRLDEERTRFDPATDKEVVAFFEWQGLAGAHRIVVKWSSSDGAHATSSALDYVAKDRRFGAYWTFPLNPSVAPGIWSVEATVDGQPAGRAMFELAAMAPGATVVSKRPLSSADIYARLNAAVLILDRQTATGQRLDPAVAFSMGSGLLATAVAALDGADVIDAIAADGSRRRIESLLGSNRRQDWAVVAGGPMSEAPMPLAGAGAVKVGDRCFSMEGAPTGGRILVEGAVTGQLEGGASGPRYLVQWANGAGTPGAPVVNEYGERFGLVGGALVNGVSTVSDLLHFRAQLKGIPVVPASLVRWVPGAAPVSLADARVGGQLLPAVRGAEHVLSGGFAKRLLRANTLTPSEIVEEFTASDKTLIAFINWAPQTRVKGMVALRIFDENGHVVGDSKPRKLDLRQGTMSLQRWDLPVPPLPGWYRAEFLLDGVPFYRAFMRVAG